MDHLEIVYSNTWHFAVDDYPGPFRVSANAVDAGKSRIKCDFDKLIISPIDWDVPGPNRLQVAIRIWDDPTFFSELTNDDREFLLQILANLVMCLLRDGRPQYQFGFPVHIFDGENAGNWEYVEYKAAVIETTFGSHAITPRRIARIWSAVPPKRFR